MRALIIAAALLAAPAAFAVATNATVPNGAIACADRDIAQQAVDLLAEGDHEALDQLVMPRFITGECTMIPRGTRVLLVDVRFSGDTTQIRVPGEAARWWVGDRTLTIDD